MAKLDKADVLKKLKEYKFSEKDKTKRAELIEAVNNATEDNIELVEHTAKLQIGYMTMDITAKGNTSSDSNGSYTTRTINQQINSARHIWLVSGDVKVAETSELRNGLSPNKEAFKEVNMNSSYYGGYVYRAGNESCAAEFLARAYSREYFRKLNMYHESSKANSFAFVPETDPYDLSYWEVTFKYTDKKGKEKRIKIGFVYEDDLSKEKSIELVFPWDKEKDLGKIVKPVLITVAVIAVILIWYFFFRP